VGGLSDRPTDRPIDAVVFDFGGVLTAASPFDLLGALGEEAGVAPEVVLDRLLGPYHEDTDHPFHRMERGEISAVAWFAEAATALAEIGVELSVEKMAAVFRTLGVHDVVVERVRALRADGYKTAILTNNVREASETWRTMLDVDALFDVIVDSSAVGMRKPNPAIYRHTLELLGGVEPERAVFLDDAESNVVAARAIGMHGIVVGPDPLPALAELDGILGSGV
jgi:putative hydrolase of the HAD superfamily